MSIRRADRRVITLLAVLCAAILQLPAAINSRVAMAATPVNVAAQANGGVATASSAYTLNGTNYSAAGANNGDRKGLNWGNGGGWNDATDNVFPDWLQVTFNAAYNISQIDVFTVQDNYGAPADPTPEMTFTQWGVTDFRVQYLSNGTWVDVPGGNVTGNNRVWRTFSFAPINTDAIRVLVTGALNNWSRITEFEAWALPSGGSINAAAQANGGIASASSAYTIGGTNFLPAGANNGDRRGLNWGNGGGWNDATENAFPDWLQVSFNNTYTIGEINVFTVQDNYAAPSAPTLDMTFTQWGITDFQVQYSSNGSWVGVPGGNVTGNNRVWRTFTFAPISTNAIRVLVNGALNSYARITEVEAWTVAGGSPPNAPPTINFTTTPTNNSTVVAPATVTLSATATDSDGAVSKVEFYRNGTLIGTVSTPSLGVYSVTDANVGPGSYSYTALAYDNATPAAVTSSAASLITVTASTASSVNVAAQINGGFATASSTFSTGFPAAGANNGDRKGVSWANGGGWNDGTLNTSPDWLQVSFNRTYTIGEIDVFTVQDNYPAPTDPTPEMTFIQWGIVDFQVQYLSNGAWLDVPGGNIAGNNLVWRRIAFEPITTSAIRVLVSHVLNGYSRITELEAWTVGEIGPLPPPPPSSITLQPFAGGFASPVGIEHSGDASGRLFVVEQGGRIKIINGGVVQSTPFLDISSLVVAGGEQGLLGLAFHPNYISNGFFYINYTRAGDGATVVARYERWAGNPDSANPSSGVILLTVPQPFTNHNGGQLRFGPDGYLYIALGDGGSGNDPGNRAQNLSTALGKMLRIDVNSGSPYAVPPTNPFLNDGDPNTLGEIWAYGLRNPWRFSFDRLTGDLFIADVGQGAWEEINFQAAGSSGGRNYGWRMMEGANCTGLGGGVACFDASLTLPVLQYDHGLGCSVTGGYRYRGSANTSLAGYFLYGDFCSGRIWAAGQYPSGIWAVNNQVTVAPFNISTFGEDQVGELYVASYGTGVIYRISAP